MGSEQGAKTRALDASHILGGARFVVEAVNGRLPFQNAIATRLSPDVVWSEIERALNSSKTSLIWPNELATVISDNVEPHAVIEVTYKFLFKKKTFHYKITQFEPGHRLSYQAMKDHVFAGGAEIEVEPTENGSVLKWHGEYKFDVTHFAEAAAFRFYFRDRFFKRLEENIRKLEAELMMIDRKMKS